MKTKRIIVAPSDKVTRSIYKALQLAKTISVPASDMWHKKFGWVIKDGKITKNMSKLRKSYVVANDKKQP